MTDALTDSASETASLYYQISHEYLIKSVLLSFVHLVGCWFCFSEVMATKALIKRQRFLILTPSPALLDN